MDNNGEKMRLHVRTDLTNGQKYEYVPVQCWLTGVTAHLAHMQDVVDNDDPIPDDHVVLLKFLP